MEENILPVEAIQERDVDLILLEELATDNSFCEWFINELDLPKISENQMGTSETLKTILFTPSSEFKS